MRLLRSRSLLSGVTWAAVSLYLWLAVSSRARVDFDGLELDKSFVERSKESLDLVVPNLVVADVIQMFRAIKVL